jgi:nitrogen fixation NifU-like protein
LYTPTTVDHFSHPRNVGRLEDADGVGRVDDRATDNLITIYLKLADARVAVARFRTFGCSACIAASSIATELVQGHPLAEVAQIDAAAILDALGGLPPDKQHCADLAARALKQAVELAAS